MIYMTMLLNPITGTTATVTYAWAAVYRRLFQLSDEFIDNPPTLGEDRMKEFDQLRQWLLNDNQDAFNALVD